jgi:hypothetical protein
MKRMIDLILIAVLSCIALATTASAEVKQVRMKIAGYLCGN